MGVEPTGDIARCRPPVLKTGTITGPHALPRISSLTNVCRRHSGVVGNLRGGGKYQGLKPVQFLVAWRGPNETVSRLLFRTFGAAPLPLFTHGLRRGLHSCAASRLQSQRDHFLFRRQVVTVPEWRFFKGSQGSKQGRCMQERCTARAATKQKGTKAGNVRGSRQCLATLLVPHYLRCG